MSIIRLLCVTSGDYPPKTGGDQALFNAYRLLQDHVELHIFKIHFNSTLENEDQLRKELPRAHFFVYDSSKRDRYSTVEAITHKIRYQLQKLFGATMQNATRTIACDIHLERNQPLLKKLNEYIANNNIDIIQFEFIQSLFNGWGIIGDRVKKVFVHHELGFVVDKQRMPSVVTLDQEMMYAINKNRELSMLESYDAILTLSPDDSIRLKKEGVKTPIFTSFAKVTPVNKKDLLINSIKKRDLVFVGPEFHIPNKMGIKWFLENVWDRILDVAPNIKLHIIGRWSYETKENYQKRYRNLIFDGFVDDLASVIGNQIMIVPIRQGTGLRMKIFDAIECLCPVVSCTVGAEGLGLTSGKECYITDDAHDFAKCILHLYSDHFFATQMANSAAEFFKIKYSDDAFIQSRMICYNSLVSK